MAACGGTGTAGVAAADPGPRGAAAQAAAQYWTAERMAAAKPVEAAHTAAPAQAPRSALRASGVRTAAPAGTPQGSYGDGLPMVGTFFSSAGPTGATYCTASVVQSPGHDLVLTAGHCAKSLAGGGQRIFVPQYVKGRDAAGQPYGVFPVDQVFTDPRYTRNSKGPDSDLDFGFARLSPNARGENAEDVTGALRLTPTPRWSSTVTVVGYPASNNPGQRALSCTVPTYRLTGFRQMAMTCGGYYGGVSGGPWITNYDARTRTGDVIGTIGGFYGGGNTNNDDWISYSPVYDGQARALYDDAVAGRTPQRPTPYQPPSDRARLAGAASTWTHANHLVAGDYDGDGRDDLLTVWSDGEVSFYPGDGDGGFGTERQFAPANSFWKLARAVTAGDFSGSSLPDLLVRWDNGKLSYYEDVRPTGTGTEYTLAAGGSSWKYATQITAGRYDSADAARDIVVRWVDGSLTTFPGVNPTGMGSERRLAEAGSFWKNAVAVTSMQPAGSDHSALAVRWTDGSLGSYTLSGTSMRGTRLQAPNTLWAPAVMTAGRFASGDGGSTADDLLVRWSNGETSLYDGTRGDTLGTWTTLVQPPA
ncbi:trypsin-like serine peptidase [Streptomyces mashuensis]|uniref:trypsin-like serine peptidase n=1 Tax=Streptomyces mashuensis TaxID=33904 RepID=UPI00167D9957|nr:trypsin-like serine protease [Streptomyces mashuensis]